MAATDFAGRFGNLVNRFVPRSPAPRVPDGRGSDVPDMPGAFPAGRVAPDGYVPPERVPVVDVQPDFVDVAVDGYDVPSGFVSPDGHRVPAPWPEHCVKGGTDP